MSVVVTAGGGRGNGLDTAGWDAVMDGLAGATAVTSLNGVRRLGGLSRGGQAEVELVGSELGGREAVGAVGRLLRRSEATLTKAQLGWAAVPLMRRPCGGMAGAAGPWHHTARGIHANTARRIRRLMATLRAECVTLQRRGPKAPGLLLCRSFARRLLG